MKTFFKILYILVYMLALLLTFAVTTDSGYLFIAILGLATYVLGEALIKTKPNLKWITRSLIVLIVFIYIIYPKNFTQCGSIGTCSTYTCNGVFVSGIDTAFCEFGNLKRIN